MKDLYTASKRLYEQAFPGEDSAFTESLFALGFPSHLEGLAEQGELLSMLFALPYDIITEQGVLAARYLYAVATDPRHRGKGYAKHLLAQIAAEGYPVFLRPMSPSLFAFYASAGLKPFSPYSEQKGKATEPLPALQHLTPEAYLQARAAFLRPPYCQMTPDFLRVCFSIGGAVAQEGVFAALYERDGNTVLFKEWWGEPSLAPRAAASLGAAHYTVRFPDPNGTPFGMGVNIPEGTIFLSALD